MKIKYTNEFLKDIDNLKEYALLFSDESAVEKRFSKIIDRIESLAKTPNIGAFVKSRLLCETEHRYLVCERYLVIYIPVGEIVKIVRIFDGRQDWQQFFV